jgi:hypothetical protein
MRDGLVKLGRQIGERTAIRNGLQLGEAAFDIGCLGL